MRIGGFRLFLLASCPAAAAASWFTTEGLALRAALASLALIAAVPLVVVLLGRADPEAPVAPESRETETGRAKRARGQPRQRGPERLETLETQLGGISEQLAEHQQALYELAKTLRKLKADNTQRAERL